MGLRVPRITINADFGDDAAFGDLSLLSVGYGLHQAWMYATMFGASSIFGTQAYIEGLHGTHVTLAYLVSIIVYCACLLFAAATDQKFLSFYLSKKTLIGGALLASVGTALLLIPALPATLVLQVISGVLTGLGSSVLILFWGVAFARCDSASIVLNTSVAIPISIGIYAIGLHFGPFPISGLMAVAIPLLELAILWNKTPELFSKRRELPVFKPLPVNHVKFFAKFAAPVLVLGLALGMLRQTSIQYILPVTTVNSQMVVLLAAGCATILILITILALGGEGRWSRYFRPLVPFIAVTALFLPFAQTSNDVVSSLALIIGYLCFEALMWIFFGELSQRFRLSPILVFGLGRGMLGIGILIGSLFPVFAATWANTMPFGEQGIIIVMLIVMVFAYALLPREREIESIVAPCPLVKAVSLGLNNSTRPLTPPVPISTEEHDSKDAVDMPPKASDDKAASAALCPHLADTREPDKTSRPGVASSFNTSASSSSPLSTSKESLDNERRGGGRFRVKCETVANTYLLSRRETEIMFFLAKGNNAAYLQEKLYISEGTAKTHIRHIYRKLNVHTQQDLMRLVETAEGSE